MFTKDSIAQRHEVDRIMNALGDQTRRDILALLKAHPLAVGDIAEQLPISRPAVSKHLRILASAGLVSFTPNGTRNIFHINKQGFDAARSYIDSFWDEALAGFQRIAEATNEQDQHGLLPNG
jgi:DNA-binding transcriptional ArsR family regulator